MIPSPNTQTAGPRCHRICTQVSARARLRGLLCRCVTGGPGRESRHAQAAPRLAGPPAIGGPTRDWRAHPRLAGPPAIGGPTRDWRAHPRLAGPPAIGGPTRDWRAHPRLAGPPATGGPTHGFCWGVRPGQRKAAHPSLRRRLMLPCNWRGSADSDTGSTYSRLCFKLALRHSARRCVTVTPTS